jgi:hypothetical protein
VVGLAHIAPLDEVDLLVTDDALPPAARTALTEAGCAVATPTTDPTDVDGAGTPQTPLTEETP